MWLCEVGEITSEVYGFRPCRHSVKETSNVTNFATLLPHPEDTARRFAGPKRARATRIKKQTPKDYTRSSPASRRNGSSKRRSRFTKAARVPARTLDYPHNNRGADR